MWINYTPEQKAIYKQGDSLHDIARMFDRFHSSIMHAYNPPDRWLLSSLAKEAARAALTTGSQHVWQPCRIIQIAVMTDNLHHIRRDAVCSSQ